MIIKKSNDYNMFTDEIKDENQNSNASNMLKIKIDKSRENLKKDNKGKSIILDQIRIIEGKNIENEFNKLDIIIKGKTKETPLINIFKDGVKSTDYDDVKNFNKNILSNNYWGNKDKIDRNSIVYRYPSKLPSLKKNCDNYLNKYENKLCGIHINNTSFIELKSKSRSKSNKKLKKSSKPDGDYYKVLSTDASLRLDNIKSNHIRFKNSKIPITNLNDMFI